MRCFVTAWRPRAMDHQASVTHLGGAGRRTLRPHHHAAPLYSTILHLLYEFPERFRKKVMHMSDEEKNIMCLNVVH